MFFNLSLNVLAFPASSLGISLLNCVGGRLKVQCRVIPNTLKAAFPVGALTTTGRLSGLGRQHRGADVRSGPDRGRHRSGAEHGQGPRCDRPALEQAKSRREGINRVWNGGGGGGRGEVRESPEQAGVVSEWKDTSRLDRLLAVYEPGDHEVLGFEGWQRRFLPFPPEKFREPLFTTHGQAQRLTCPRRNRRYIDAKKSILVRRLGFREVVSSRQLDHTLEPDQFAKAVNVLATAGMPAQVATRIKPWLVFMMLAVPACERQE